jgi:TRAP-type C4-dicarboxylate transport system permease large subunit
MPSSARRLMQRRASPTCKPQSQEYHHPIKQCFPPSPKSYTSPTRCVDARVTSLPVVPVLIAVPGLTLPFVIRAAVIGGVATATEVSTVGVVYTALLGLLVYREFDWRRIYPILVDTVSLTGAVMLIIGTATAMAWALTQSGFSQWLVSIMAGVPGGTAGFLAITIIAFIVLGSVLEGLPAIVLFGPLLFPVAKAMGVHEVHYAMIVILAMGIGLFAPPFGVGYYRRLCHRPRLVR